MGTYLTPLSVPGTLQVLSSYCSVPALWRTSLWPLPDGNWSSAALGTEEPLPDNNQQQEGAPGHQGALEQPWSKPSWIGASAVTAGGPAGASSRSCSCSLHPRSIRSRQGRCWWLAGPWHPSPGLPPCQSLPSCLPVLGERPHFCSLRGTCVPQPDGILVLPRDTGLVPKWPNPCWGRGPWELSPNITSRTRPLPSAGQFIPLPCSQCPGRCGRTVPHCWP